MGCFKSRVSGVAEAKEADEEAQTASLKSFPSSEPKPQKMISAVQQKLDYDYRVDVKVLGHGSYAKVYRGVRRSDGLVVAIKCINKAKSRTELLNNEISIMKKYSAHKHIVSFFSCYESELEMQLVLEFMPGGELFQVLIEDGAYEEKDAAQHMRSLSSAMVHLHTNNIAHRDLKPENLLLTEKPNGILKLSDFGLAMVLKDDQLMHTAAGTWAYTAPEVLNVKKSGFGAYGLQCDMFSVGVLMFVLLGGYHPFDPDGSSDVSEMQTAIREGVWDFEDAAWDEVSQAAKDIITELLQPDPKKRMTASQLSRHSWLLGKKKYGNLHKDISTELTAYRDRMARKRLKASLCAVQTTVHLIASTNRWSLTRETLRQRITMRKQRRITTVGTKRTMRQWGSAEILLDLPHDLKPQPNSAESGQSGNSSGSRSNRSRRKERPISAERRAAIHQLFAKLDTDGNGCLNDVEFKPLTKLMCCAALESTVSDEDFWQSKYQELCEMCSADVETGIDRLMLEVLMDSIESDFYATDFDVEEILRNLGSTPNGIAPTRSTQRKEREHLAQAMFFKLDMNEDGWLDEQEIFPLVKLLGFEGDDAKWHEEYLSICQDCHWTPHLGINQATLTLLMNTPANDFYIPDADLGRILREVSTLQPLLINTRSDPRSEGQASAGISTPTREVSKDSILTSTSARDRGGRSPRNNTHDQALRIGDGGNKVKQNKNKHSPPSSQNGRRARGRTDPTDSMDSAGWASERNSVISNTNSITDSRKAARMSPNGAVRASGKLDVPQADATRGRQAGSGSRRGASPSPESRPSPSPEGRPRPRGNKKKTQGEPNPNMEMPNDAKTEPAILIGKESSLQSSTHVRRNQPRKKQRSTEPAATSNSV